MIISRTNIESHNHESSGREKLLEHLFVGELLKHLWRKGMRNVEVLRSEVDSGGYDLVLECDGILRHIQLKASHQDSSTANVGINLHLAGKPSGCVIWLWFNPDTLQFNRYLWFGGTPGKPLPPLGDKAGKHSRGNKTGYKAERPNIRIVGRRAFTALATMDELAEVLFSKG
jgi:hypothetical protein